MESPNEAVVDSTESSSSEAHTVKWEGPADTNNPRNWASSKKWKNVLLISIQATLSPMASVMLAVCSDAVAHDFGITDTYTISLPTAFFVLGFGVGPMFLAPISEMFGRRVVYLSCFAAFTVTNIFCAVAPNIAALSVFRLLCGMAGSAGPSIGGGTIGDMFTPETRGKAQSVYSFGPTGGSALGAIIGSFILAGTSNWRWIAWVMAIAAGITSVASIIFMDESFAPVLLRKKAKQLRESTSDPEHQSEFETKLSLGQLLARNITRAGRMLVTAPACTAMSIYMALIYGILYLHMVTLPLLFGPASQYGLATYGWSQSTLGLSYLGVGIGSALGVFACATGLNRSFAFMKARASRLGHTENREPEYRMVLMQIGAIIVVVGLMIFAFTARTDVHWIAPLIGAAVFSSGMLVTYICVTTYLVDSFERYAASALAAMTLVRSVFGCVFSLIGFKLYESLGYRMGTLLLALLCVALMPLPAVFYFYGPRLRKMWVPEKITKSEA